MNKQIQKSTQISKDLLMMCVIATLVLFFFSCDKKEIPVKREIYTVSFDSKGGSKVDAIEVKHGDMVKLPADPTKDGFIFEAWYTDEDAIASPFYSQTTPITADLTLYAKWESLEHFCTVTFDSNGGSEVEPIKVRKGKTIPNLPTPPIKKGFYFWAWYLDKETRYTPFFSRTTPINSDLTVYARWVRIP